MNINRTIVVERDSRELTTQVVQALAEREGLTADVAEAKQAATDASAAAISATEAAGAASAAAYEAVAAASFTVASIDALKASEFAFPVGSIILCRAEGVSVEALPAIAEPLMKRLPPIVGGSLDGAELLDPVIDGYTLVTVGGVKLRPATTNNHVLPRMFGAVANGVANDRDAIQASFIWSAAKFIECKMEGRDYTSNEAIYTDTNLRLDGQGATIYYTGWPVVGGFFTNVWGGRDIVNASLRRVQSRVRIKDLILDGGRLVPVANFNSNLFGFARGASDFVISECWARKMQRGTGGGTGGAGFGDELGATDIHWFNCTAVDCYRGSRTQAESTSFEDEAAQSKRLRRIRFTNFTAIRCGCAILALTPLASQLTELASSDLDVYDVVYEGVTTAIDCGHYPWTPIDYATQNVQPQKTGVIVSGGGRNIRIKHLRCRIASNTTTRENWLGTGYPAAGTNFVGAGLSGDVGAVFWGHGRNIVIDQIELDGWVDSIVKIARAVSFGEIASTPPTYYPPGTDPIPNAITEQIRIGEIRHIRGAISYVFDGMQTTGGVGLDNSRLSIRVGPVSVNSYASGGGTVGPNGTVGLSNVMLELVGSTGRATIGTAEYFKANGVSYNVTKTVNGGFAVDGGYSATGARDGWSYSSGAARSSVSVAAQSAHAAFYNPNGLVGSVTTTGTATAYNTSSDARLKSDPRDFDASGIIAQFSVHDFAWNSGGRGYGLFAQEAVEVMPEAVFIGDDDDAWNAKGIGERIPWAVNYNAIVPVLIRAFQQQSQEISDLKQQIAALS